MDGQETQFGIIIHIGCVYAFGKVGSLPHESQMLGNQKGFTLIEILIVVTIIALLASVILVGLQPARTVARDTRRLLDLNEVKKGLELYFNKCGYYPGQPVPDPPPCGAFMQISTWQELTDALVGSNIGVDALPKDITAGSDYFYATDQNGRKYILGATLEDPNSSLFTNSVHDDKLTFAVPFSCESPVYCTRL